MKQVITVVVLFFSLITQAADDQRLEEAESAYDKKNYARAITVYEQLLAEGYTSYQLYFNLGNAYYRANQLGKAIFNYERAHKLQPADEDVTINLGIAQSKTIDKIDAKENYFISVVKTSILSSLSTNAWGWLTVLFLVLTAVAYFFFSQSAAPSIRRIMFFSAIVFLLAFLVSYFLGFSALTAKNQNKYAIITTAEVKISNEPIEGSKSKFVLHEGTKIRVVETSGNWVLIKLDNGNEGWVHNVDIGII